MGLCPTPVGYVTKKMGDDIGVKVPVNCKRWDCPHCGSVNKKRLMDRIGFGFDAPKFRFERKQAGLKGGFRVRFMTLTELKKPDNPEHKNIMVHWSRLRANLHDKGYKFIFFWSKEFRPRGCKYCEEHCEHAGEDDKICVRDTTWYRHLHIMLSVYIPRYVVKKAWCKATNQTANIVYQDGKMKDILNAAGYCSKYFSKEMIDGFSKHAKKRERRYGCSMHKDKDGKRKSDFPLVIQEEIHYLDGESAGFVNVRVDGEKFKWPVKGEWEFTYDPAYWLRSADAVDNEALAIEKIESLNRLIEFIEKHYPNGR